MHRRRRTPLNLRKSDGIKPSKAPNVIDPAIYARAASDELTSVQKLFTTKTVFPSSAGICVHLATLFERLTALCNDVGLLAEECDPRDTRMLGNFPQAFSHVALINTALDLAHALGDRSEKRPTATPEGSRK